MYPYIIHLDRMMRVTGSYDAGNDETTWTLPTGDDSLDTIVMSDEFSNPGEVLTPDSNLSGIVKKSGDYGGAEAVIGRSYTFQVHLTRPYVRDRNDHADVDAWCQVRDLTASYHDTGALTVRSSMPLRNDRTVSKQGDVERIGKLKAWHNGHAEELDQFLESSSPKPCTVTSVEFTCDYAPRHSRGSR